MSSAMAALGQKRKRPGDEGKQRSFEWKFPVYDTESDARKETKAGPHEKPCEFILRLGEHVFVPLSFPLQHARACFGLLETQFMFNDRPETVPLLRLYLDRDDLWCLQWVLEPLLERTGYFRTCDIPLNKLMDLVYVLHSTEVRCIVNQARRVSSIMPTEPFYEEVTMEPMIESIVTGLRQEVYYDVQSTIHQKAFDHALPVLLPHLIKRLCGQPVELCRILGNRHSSELLITKFLEHVTLVDPTYVSESIHDLTAYHASRGEVPPANLATKLRLVQYFNLCRPLTVVDDAKLKECYDYPPTVAWGIIKDNVQGAEEQNWILCERRLKAFLDEAQALLRHTRSARTHSVCKGVEAVVPMVENALADNWYSSRRADRMHAFGEATKGAGLLDATRLVDCKANKLLKMELYPTSTLLNVVHYLTH